MDGTIEHTHIIFLFQIHSIFFLLKFLKALKKGGKKVRQLKEHNRLLIIDSSVVERGREKNCLKLHIHIRIFFLLKITARAYTHMYIVG